MPEVRVDPLTGLRTIVAADRANRPNAGLRASPADPIDPAGDPFAEGHEQQTPPELFALRPGVAEPRPDTPGWTVRVVPNLYPALTPDAPEPGEESHRDLFTTAPARGGHEVIVNAPQSVTLAGAAAGRAGRRRRCTVWQQRMRAHADAACRPPDRQRAARGRRLAAAHARAAVRARLRAGGDRPRARALRRPRDPHDGRQPARRPRAGGGAAARADRRDRRRGGRLRAVREPPAVRS